ncbi:MAG TPA: SDR family oxidoreductase [Thermomicrobiales bacterium]|nr:SDR family oxidoreductase [Thermomicrobiales bacterium]
MTHINGSVAFVTGGNRGIGKRTVDELLARGAAKVYATARNPQPSEDPRIVVLQLDVTDKASIAAAAAEAQDVQILINNAGILGAGLSTLGVDLDDARAVFETNVFAPLAVTQAFAPILAKNGGGVVVNIHSALSWAAGWGAVGASKAAIWSFSNSLRVDLEGQQTRVIGVHLGYTDTDLVAALDVPKNDPRDIARAIADGIENDEVEVLADDTAKYVKSLLSGPVTALELNR